MNNNEVNTIESIIKDEDILNLEIVCEKEYLTKSQLEEQLILLIIYKMYYEHSFNLPIKIEDIQKYGTKLHELFTKLDLPCNHFNKVPVLEIYDELKTYLISIIYENKYGSISPDLTNINLKIDKYTVLSSLKKYKEIANIIDIGYRLITNKTLVKKEEKDRKENYINEIGILIENIEMINLISNPNEREYITFLEYFDLFIEYQKSLKEQFHEILDDEYLTTVYTDMDITRYITDCKSDSVTIKLDIDYGKVSKYIQLEKEKIANKIRYIWDKSRILKNEKSLDKIFSIAEKNKTYIENKNFFNPAHDDHLSVLIYPENDDKYKNIGITYNDGTDIINIQSNYIDDEMTYILHINGTTINILNEDIEPILESLFINIEFLPKYMQDFIAYKNKKKKFKQKTIEII